MMEVNGNGKDVKEAPKALYSIFNMKPVSAPKLVSLTTVPEVNSETKIEKITDSVNGDVVLVNDAKKMTPPVITATPSMFVDDDDDDGPVSVGSLRPKSSSIPSTSSLQVPASSSISGEDKLTSVITTADSSGKKRPSSMELSKDIVINEDIADDDEEEDEEMRFLDDEVDTMAKTRRGLSKKAQSTTKKLKIKGSDEVIEFLTVYSFDPVSEAIRLLNELSQQSEKKVNSFFTSAAPVARVTYTRDNLPVEAPFSLLAQCFEAIESTTKRLVIVDHLVRLLRILICVFPNDLLPALYLCTNSIAPAFESVELGVGDSLLIKALAQSTGREVKDIKADFDRRGDLGDVAQAARTSQKTLFSAAKSGGLTIRHVFQQFRNVAFEKGQSSQDKKVSCIHRLLVSARPSEAKFIIRGMQGKLRIGLAERSVVIALAQAFELTKPINRNHNSGSKSSDLPPLRYISSAAALEKLQFSALYTRPSDRNRIARASEVEIADSEMLPLCLDTSTLGNVTERLEEAEQVIKQMYSELPSFSVLVPALLVFGIEGARERCQLRPGIPVAPMLAKPTKGIREVLTRFEGLRFTSEFKYDGERAQVHVLSDGTVKIFSRNSEDTTGKYPDVGEALRMAMGQLEPVPTYPSSPAENAIVRAKDADTVMDTSPKQEPVISCVLDGEAVAYDVSRGTLLPFQVLSKRSRKDVTIDSVQVPVIYIAFDILYLNGESLVHKCLSERREIMKRVLRPVPGRFDFCQSRDADNTEEIATFLNESVQFGCEGLMVKLLDGAEAVYEPSKRSLNWLKLKKDYMDGLTDSFDLVPIGAWRGKGKRTGVYGAYLLACYDPDTEEYQSVCKVGTGFSDEALQLLTNVFNVEKQDCIRETKPRNVIVGDALADADVWFSPEDSEVWEVMAADLSISPVHMGAVGKADPDKGIGLRFPRFLRRRELDDKAPADATTAEQIFDMYCNQSTVVLRNDDDEY